MTPPSATSTSLSIRRRAAFFAVYFLALIIVALAASEVIVRIKGLKPWNPEDPGITVEPGGKLFKRHSTVGYAHLPGEYIITLPTGLAFHATHGPDSNRITHLENGESGQREEIWIFGCSFTYGWAVNDEQTYAWLLQEKLPQYEFVNFAVNGYGTLHSFLQFQEALKERRKPAYAIVAYASFHDERNVFTRFVRKYIVPWNRLGPMLQPYARLNGDGTFRYAMADMVYREFPLMRQSAFINYVENRYNLFEYRHLQAHKVSEAILLEVSRLARNHGTELIIADIGNPPTIMDFARRHEIKAVDISVDVSLPANNNLPHDSHPSAAAHRQYADKLESYLRKIESIDAGILPSPD